MKVIMVMSSLAAVAVQLSSLAIVAVATTDMSVDPPVVKPLDKPTFHIKITNVGETPLDPVKVVDTLPEGLSYVSDNKGGRPEGDEVVWDNVSALDIGKSIEIDVLTQVGEFASGELNNLVNVTGVPPTGYAISDRDNQSIMVVTSKDRHARPKNIDYIDMGDQSARSVGHATAANNILVKENQDCGQCCPKSNSDSVIAHRQTANAWGSGAAVNNLKIFSSQH